MSLLLDDMRREFARFLAEDPGGRWRMDKALAHVITLAYARGLQDGREEARGERAPLLARENGRAA